jgi:hypothetical protein
LRFNVRTTSTAIPTKAIFVNNPCSVDEFRVIPALATGTQNMASSRKTTIHNFPTEMLEHVLLQLSMKDILQSMRVCKQWCRCITESLQLQVALFMKPLKSEEAQDSQPNPLLLEIFPAFFMSTGETDESTSENEWENEGEYESGNEHSETVKMAHTTVNQAIDKLSWSKNEAWSIAIARPTASWRRMYTEQPPKRHVFKCEKKFGFLTPSSITETMDTLYSKMV